MRRAAVQLELRIFVVNLTQTYYVIISVLHQLVTVVSILLLLGIPIY